MIGEVEAGGRTAEILSEVARAVTGRLDVKRSRRSTLLQPFLDKFTKKAS